MTGARARAPRTPTAPNTQATNIAQHSLKDKMDILTAISPLQFNALVLNELSEPDVNVA